MQTDEPREGIVHHRVPNSCSTDAPVGSRRPSPRTAPLRSPLGESVPGIMVQWESVDAAEAESALRLGPRST